jgi:hypothetical protein
MRTRKYIKSILIKGSFINEHNNLYYFMALWSVFLGIINKKLPLKKLPLKKLS